MRDFPKATGELSGLLRDIGLAAKRVNVEVNKAGLVDILGDTGDVNVQGEEVKKLDVFANNQFVGVLSMVLVVRVLAAKNWMISLCLMMK